ncbi:Oxidation resistance protein 1 [Thelohanellus kitauei]|uniref:Oxidation resistance protein 1 n=1 Tax=Thelohanellus kitauei TaxID=669202 RepID=A0A0C2JCA0_THEKT|nr:Oxidation resistance protein 1 [Thelohanellus kitauei]
MEFIKSFKSKYAQKLKRLDSLPPKYMFSAYCFCELYFIPGSVMLVNSEKRQDPEYFDHIKFINKIDDITQDIMAKKQRFTLPVQFVQKIVFYTNSDFITSKTAPPIDLSDEKLDLDSRDIEDDITIDDTCFCKIISRIPDDKEFSNLLNLSWISEKKSTFHKSVMILLLTKERCVFLQNNIKRWFPNIQIEPYVSQKVSKESLNIIQHKFNRMELLSNDTARNISEKGTVLTIKILADILPFICLRVSLHPLDLVFSTTKNGHSLRNLYRVIENFSYRDRPPLPFYILIMSDSENKIFGALLTNITTPREEFMGSRDSFVFMYVEDEIKVKNLNRGLQIYWKERLLSHGIQ